MENKKSQEALDQFLDLEAQKKAETAKTEEVKVIQDKSILERINKKIITEDGRQLLF